MHRNASVPIKDTEMLGQIDSENPGGSLDRSVITKPVSTCVKCSKNAIICVNCMEATVDTCLRHYRKSRGLGAKILLDNAVINTGACKLTKFLVFRAWKNGSKYRNSVEIRNVDRAGKWWRHHQMYPLFKAWKLFIDNVLRERKQKSVDQLDAKISLLEQNVNKLSKECKDYTNEIDSLRRLCAEKDGEILRLSESSRVVSTTAEAKIVSRDESIQEVSENGDGCS